MAKDSVRADASACSECYSCQLICSLVYTGAFNPLKARIIIRPGEISFTDECVETCSLCTHYCAYGALTRP
jgi:NAD-dependent dihydropyrimidine dehydrogenase PreA subunit